MRRGSFIAAGALILAYALAFQGTRGLWEPDEGRYAAIAAHMLRTGDYLVPHVNQERPHLAKPPLTYWTVAAGMRLLGWNEWGARLANGLAHAATVGLVWLLGRWLLPARPWLAALAYASMPLPYLAANIVVSDPLLGLWETLAVAAFVASWRRRAVGASHGLRALMWLAFGLAFLTKGPPGLLPLAAMAVFVVVAEGPRALTRLVSASGLVLFVAVGFSWYAGLAISHPEALERLIRLELWDRIATEKLQRNAEWYGIFVVYLPTFLIGALPWSVVLLGRLAGARAVLRRAWWRERLAADPLAAFTAIWLLVPLAIFLLARSRLPLYVLPLFVPLALLVARELDRRWPPTRWARALLAAWLVALPGARLAAALIDAPDDGRPVARAIAALPGAPPGHVVFVDVHPHWGIAMYLRADVKEVSIGPEVAWWANSDLATELDQAVPDTLYVVPEHALPRFEGVLAARGLGHAPRGRHDDRILTVLLPRPDVPSSEVGAVPPAESPTERLDLEDEEAQRRAQ